MHENNSGERRGGNLGKRDPFVSVVAELVRAGWKQPRANNTPQQTGNQPPRVFTKAAQAAGEAALYAEGLDRPPEFDPPKW